MILRTIYPRPIFLPNAASFFEISQVFRMSLRNPSLLGFFVMDVRYTAGPRYIDGVNIDADVLASIPIEAEVGITDPVTDLKGRGYEPGQKNLDGTDL